MVEGGNDLLCLAAISLDHEGLAQIVDNHVAQNTALRAEQKSIHTVSGGEIADVVGNHSVQPPHAVTASKGDSRAESQVIDSTTVQQSSELLLRIGKARRRHRATVVHCTKRPGSICRLRSQCVLEWSG